VNRTPRNPYEEIAADLRKAAEAGTYPVGSHLLANETIRASYKSRLAR
jgi:hypothetical protein